VILILILILILKLKLEVVYEEADIDGDNNINYQEFLAAMERFTSGERRKLQEERAEQEKANFERSDRKQEAREVWLAAQGGEDFDAAEKENDWGFEGLEKPSRAEPQTEVAHPEPETKSDCEFNPILLM